MTPLTSTSVSTGIQAKVGAAVEAMVGQGKFNKINLILLGF
jgi:hypothetical protein